MVEVEMVPGQVMTCHKSMLELVKPDVIELEVGDEFSLMPGRIRIKYVSEKFVVARYLTGKKCEFGKERKDFERFLECELVTKGDRWNI